MRERLRPCALMASIVPNRIDYWAGGESVTSSEAMGKEVIVKVTRQDQSGRRFVEVTLLDGRNLNRELLRAGWCSAPLLRE